MAKIVLMNINIHEDIEQNEYYVEAKPRKRWVRVGGPFATRDKAVTFAKNYSKTNKVKSRVVTSM